MVLHGLNVAVVIASNQAGINFVDFFGDQAIFQGAVARFAVLFVAIGHGAQLQQAVASLVHVLNVCLKALRGIHSAQLPVAVDDYRDGIAHAGGSTSYASEESTAVGDVANANGIGFGCYARVPHVNVVRTRSKASAGTRAQGEVAISDAFTSQSIASQGGVISAAVIKIKRARPDGGVVAADSVAIKRVGSAGGVVATGIVEIQRGDLVPKKRTPRGVLI